MVLPFDRILFISLKNSNGLNRRKKLIEQFETLQIVDLKGQKPEWVIADNGSKPNHIIDNSYRKQKLRRGSVSMSEIGCFQSHRKVWNLFYESGLETCLILEDDALFSDLSIFETWDKMPEWDFVNFGLITNRASIENTIQLYKQEFFHGLWSGSGMWLTHAYAINQTSCKILLEETQIQRGGLDWQLTGIQSKFKTFGFNPGRIVQRPVSFSNPSQIHHTS
jgi:GR25 family glycosyltransferase involved in LPS biosynthesis